jgi:hypothetical protein
MRHSKIGRPITLLASACLLLAFGCGLLGLAVQQGTITPRDIHVQLGPLILITRGPRSFLCPPQGNPTENLCDRMKLAPLPAVYRIWIYWGSSGRSTQSTRTLAQWTIPVRE